jgi:O-antigen ligase
MPPTAGSRIMAENRRFRDRGGVLSPGVKYVVVRSKPIPIVIRWAFLLFVFAIPFETIDIGSSSLPKLAGLVFFGCYFLHYNPLLSDRHFPGLNPPLLWFAGYLAIYLVSAAFGSTEFIRDGLMRFLTLFQLLVLFWVTADLLKDQQMINRMLLVYSISSGILATGILFHLPGFGVSMTGDGRTTSSLQSDPNVLAAVMALAVLTITGLSVKSVVKHSLGRILLSVMALPPLAVIVQTGSRTGVVAFLVGCLVYLLPQSRSPGRRGKIIIFAIIGIVGLIGLIATNPLVLERWQEAYYEGNLSRRQSMIPAALDMISERPIFGWQPMAAWYELGPRVGKPSIDAHNLILDLLVESGLVGAIPFLVGLWLCVLSAWRARKGELGVTYLALLLATIVVNMGIPGLGWKPFWLVMGLGVAAASAAATQQFRRRHVLVRSHRGHAPLAQPLGGKLA